jgi:hypothetical protein
VHWSCTDCWCCFQSVCLKLGIDTGDRLLTNSRKLKFLVRGPLPPDSVFPPFQDFDVEHYYLQTNTPTMQVRLRKRGQKGEQNKLFYRNTFVSTGFCYCHLTVTSLLALSFHNPFTCTPSIFSCFTLLLLGKSCKIPGLVCTITCGLYGVVQNSLLGAVLV